MTKSNKHYRHKHMSSEEEDSAYIRNPSTDTQQGSLSEEEEWSDDDAEGYGTPIRSRIRFSPGETKTLEDTYQKNKRPSTDTKQKLAARFETNVSRIQIWFQNRRAKEKKLNQQSSDSAHEVDSGHHGHKDDIGSSSRDDSRSSTRSSRTREPDGVPDSHIVAAQRGRKRRQEEDDDVQLPVQLRSSQQRRHSQYNVPAPSNLFYHGSGARSAELFPYYPPQHRHSDPGLIFQNYDPKYYYSPTGMIPASTINPRDVIFSNTEDYISNDPNDPFTPSPSAQQQLNLVDSNKYILNDDGYEIMAEPSPSSRNSQGGEPQQANILAHDDDPPPVEDASSAPKKGDL